MELVHWSIGEAAYLLATLLGQRLVVLLDQVPEVRGNLFVAVEEERVAGFVELLAEIELELLQRLERRVRQLLNAERILEGRFAVELPQLAHHFVEVLRRHAGLLQHLAQRLCIERALDHLTAELTNRFGGILPHIARVHTAAPGHRPAPLDAFAKLGLAAAISHLAIARLAASALLALLSLTLLALTLLALLALALLPLAILALALLAL